MILNINYICRSMNLLAHDLPSNAHSIQLAYEKFFHNGDIDVLEQLNSAHPKNHKHCKYLCEVGAPKHQQSIYGFKFIFKDFDFNLILIMLIWCTMVDGFIYDIFLNTKIQHF